MKNQHIYGRKSTLSCPWFLSFRCLPLVVSTVVPDCGAFSLSFPPPPPHSLSLSVFISRSILTCNGLPLVVISVSLRSIQTVHNNKHFGYKFFFGPNLDFLDVFLCIVREPCLWLWSHYILIYLEFHLCAKLYPHCSNSKNEPSERTKQNWWKIQQWTTKRDTQHTHASKIYTIPK